jgi:hypothetical protein
MMLVNIIVILFYFIYEVKTNVALCPSTVVLCKNSGTCVVVDNIQILCRCLVGFQGLFL